MNPTILISSILISAVLLQLASPARAMKISVTTARAGAAVPGFPAAFQNLLGRMQGASLLSATAGEGIEIFLRTQTVDLLGTPTTTLDELLALDAVMRTAQRTDFSRGDMTDFFLQLHGDAETGAREHTKFMKMMAPVRTLVEEDKPATPCQPGLPVLCTPLVDWIGQG